MMQLGGTLDPNLGAPGVRHGILESYCQLAAARFTQGLAVKPIAGVGGED
jgi:hypothetical protein